MRMMRSEGHRRMKVILSQTSAKSSAEPPCAVLLVHTTQWSLYRCRTGWGWVTGNWRLPCLRWRSARLPSCQGHRPPAERWPWQEVITHRCVGAVASHLVTSEHARPLVQAASSSTAAAATAPVLSYACCTWLCVLWCEMCETRESCVLRQSLTGSALCCVHDPAERPCC